MSASSWEKNLIYTCLTSFVFCTISWHIHQNTYVRIFPFNYTSSFLTLSHSSFIRYSKLFCFNYFSFLLLLVKFQIINFMVLICEYAIFILHQCSDWLFVLNLVCVAFIYNNGSEEKIANKENFAAFGKWRGVFGSCLKIRCQWIHDLCDNKNKIKESAFKLGPMQNFVKFL